MNDLISPKYKMELIAHIDKAISDEYNSLDNIEFYIEKWHEHDDWNWQNFTIWKREHGKIDLSRTLHGIDDETLLKIAIDIGVETPDFIPSIPIFRNEIKANYKTASITFEKAFKQIESHPDMAIGLVNSALESIIKEIFKDERIKTKPKPGKTLYDLTTELLKEFQLFPSSNIPQEIKTIGSSLLAVNGSIEKLRSEKTHVHGKTSDDYIIEDPLYTYFIINSIATIGQFLSSYYKKKFPVLRQDENLMDDLPF